MQRERQLVTGTRVRLKPPARTMSGWRGTATVLYGFPGNPIAIRDGSRSQASQGSASRFRNASAIGRRRVLTRLRGLGVVSMPRPCQSTG